MTHRVRAAAVSALLAAAASGVVSCSPVWDSPFDPENAAKLTSVEWKDCDADSNCGSGVRAEYEVSFRNDGLCDYTGNQVRITDTSGQIWLDSALSPGLFLPKESGAKTLALTTCACLPVGTYTMQFIGSLTGSRKSRTYTLSLTYLE